MNSTGTHTYLFIYYLLFIPSLDVYHLPSGSSGLHYLVTSFIGWFGPWNNPQSLFGGRDQFVQLGLRLHPCQRLGTNVR